MERTTKFIFYFVVFVSGLLILISLFSLVHDVSYWYTKIFDFPRLQYFIIGVVCLSLFLFLNHKRLKTWSTIFAFALLAVTTLHFLKIFPYYFGNKAVPDATLQEVTNQETVSILLANVLIKNKEAEKLLQIIDESDPDIILAMEINQWWIKQLQALKTDYPHSMEYPTDNAYGMALLSRYPLSNAKIKFLQHKNVPSFHTNIKLPSGKKFRFHGVHPVPPYPSKKYPDNVGKKEVALIKTADFVAQDSIPAIVAGDFNDVSWSNTSRLFEESGNLKNVRIGRGLYNSFNARSPVLRWPLDHYFVTTEFSLIEIKRLPKFGSDHFPMFASFLLND